MKELLRKKAMLSSLLFCISIFKRIVLWVLKDVTYEVSAFFPILV